MTPEAFRASRKALGLSANGMAEALRLGKGGGRTIRRYESGETPISGPVSLLVELMIAPLGRGLEKRLRALTKETAIDRENDRIEGDVGL